MKKLLLAAFLSLLAAGCVSGRNRSMGYGYFVTDDGFAGCAFRYGYYPYYDPYPSGLLNPARMDIVLVHQPRVPQLVDRDVAWPNASAGGNGIDAVASSQGERAAVTTAAPPPPTRVVAPRS